MDIMIGGKRGNLSSSGQKTLLLSPRPLRSSPSATMPKDDGTTPIVLIHGLFGWGEERPMYGLCPGYFPLEALRKLRGGPVVAVDVGTTSSSHDRACEAFAQLTGARTDYGAAHAARCGHERFGPDFQGVARLGGGGGGGGGWDGARRPIHVVGHSFGGNAAIVLATLIAEDFWGVGSDASWLASVTTICSPVRGATLPVALGLEARGRKGVLLP